MTKTILDFKGKKEDYKIIVEDYKIKVLENFENDYTTYTTYFSSYEDALEYVFRKEVKR